MYPRKEHPNEQEKEPMKENILFIIFQGKEDWHAQALSQSLTGPSNR